MVRMSKTLMLLALLLGLSSESAWAEEKANTPAKEPLAQFVEKHFDRWDHNRDGVLELDEVERKVEDHSVFGREAAVIFRIREHMTAKGNPPRLSHQQLLSLTENRSFEKSVDATTRHGTIWRRSTASGSMTPGSWP